MGAPGTTPGPWKASKALDHPCFWSIEAGTPGQRDIAYISLQPEQAGANAQQMAASGDMYDALVDELADLNEDIRWAEGSDMVRFIARRERMEAALAKAQGITS